MINELKAVVEKYPAVLPYLKGRARWIAFLHTGDELKTADEFAARLTHLIKALHGGVIILPTFVDSMAALISRQISLAYQSAWRDDGNDDAVPAYLLASAETMILGQFTFVDNFAREIRDSALANGSVQPFLARVPLWANRYNEAYNEAMRLIAVQNGGKLKWIEGDTQKKCPVCLALHGIVAYASIWEELQVFPQNAPNPALSKHAEGCKGWKCKCSLSPTDERQSRNAREKITKALEGKK